MRRRLFHLAAAISLLVFLTTIALLIRCRFADDIFGHDNFDPSIGHATVLMAEFSGGEVTLSRTKLDYGTNRRLMPQLLAGLLQPWHHDGALPQSAAHSTLWWTYHRSQTLPSLPASDDVNPRSAEGWQFGFKLWLLLPLAAILPAWWTRSTLRRRRAKRKGFCLVCGYDLRESPERCPECGTVVTSKANIEHSTSDIER